MKQGSAMGRSADITVVNTTEYAFVLQSYDPGHGRFTTNPASIDANSSNQFSVSNNAGSMVGPEGTVQYSITTGSNTSIVATVYYNLPWGNVTSTYSFASEPSVLTYQLTPPCPTGQDQSVTLTVSLSPSAA
jgi:hypothetical protein